MRRRATAVVWSVAVLTGALGLRVSDGQQRPLIDRKAWMEPVPSSRLRVLKRAGRMGANYPSQADYMRVLERFPAYAERGWRVGNLGASKVSFFGDPDHAEMGLRSMGNFIFVMSLLAAEPGYDPRVTGLSQAHVLERARTCLEYMTRSHVTGDMPCADGRPWGDHWQSAWWTAKMAIGARLIWPRLTEIERLRVEAVVRHEATRHLTRRAPGGALSNTRSEENAWDTEVLAAACAMLPHDPRASSWRARLIDFALNSLSAPQDLTSNTIVDGRPLRDQVYTTNVHSDFTIENHGAYHTCYMACPLHSLTWGYYALAAAGQPVPDAQFHHFTDVWKRMKPTFLGRRFAYPAGKDWPRYAYGMSFIMPALVVLQNRFGDQEARAIEARRFRALEEEQHSNGDGSFFGLRFTRNIMVDRMAEYETDCYANLGLCYLLHRLQAPPPRTMDAKALESALTDHHVSRDAGLAFVRTPGLFASIAWRRLDGPYPTAYFIPTASDDLPEWGPNNLLGRVTAQDMDPSRTVTEHTDTASPQRLHANGTVRYRAKDGRPLFAHHVLFEVDHARRVARIETRFAAEGPVIVTSREGLRLHVANTLFNAYRRRWHHARGVTDTLFILPEAEPPRETIRTLPLPGRWVNVDGRLGIVNLGARPDSFHLRVSDRRNGPWGSVNYSVLDCPAMDATPRAFAAGETILEGRFLLLLGDAKRTRTAAEHPGLENAR